MTTNERKPYTDAHPMKGRYFIDPENDRRGYVEAMVGADHAMVCFMEKDETGQTFSRLVPVGRMADWRFYVYFGVNRTAAPPWRPTSSQQ